MEVVEMKKVEEERVVVIREKEKDAKPEKEKADKKRKRKDEDAVEGDKGAKKRKNEKKEKKEKKDKKQKNEDKRDKSSIPEEVEKEVNGAASAEEVEVEEGTLAQRFLDAISSKKETSISKAIKKLGKGAEEEVWELLKQAKVRKVEEGKLILVLT